MVAAAREESTLSYSALVKEIRSITFQPHDFRLFHLLGRISKEEVAHGRGMLTAVVVRQEDGLPGQGFFQLAKELGFDASDQEAFWASELARVFKVWQT